MSSRPRVSVLLPCRDAEDTLPEAIASLSAQTVRNVEIVAVDDGSVDGTGELLAAWAAKDDRVVVPDGRADETATAGPKRGIVPALNRAAAVGRAPLLARMDADDIAHPRRLELQLAFLAERPHLAGCGAHVELFTDTAGAGRGAVGPGYRRYERWINAIETPEDVARAAFVECPLAHPTLVLKASVFRALGGYRDMGWAEDYDLVLRILAAGAQLANVPGEGEPLLRWRVREERLSLTAPAYDADAFRRCRVHYLRERFLPADRPVVVWGAGRVGKPLARELIRQGTSIDAFVDLDPRKVGQEIHGAPVVSPDDFVARLPRESGSATAVVEHGPAAVRPFVLAAVGTPGVRGEIRESLARYGLQEIDDFRFCA